MARRGKYLRRSLFPLVVLKQGNAVHRGSLNAGRIDQRMLDSYSHIHLDAKRNAIELALSTPIEDTTAIAADVAHKGKSVAQKARTKCGLLLFLIVPGREMKKRILFFCFSRSL